MNERGRYCQTLTFGNPDRIPLQPGGPREFTLRAWHEQGLPDDVHWHEYLLNVLGIEAETPSTQHVFLDVNFQMIPIFEEKVLEREIRQLTDRLAGAILGQKVQRSLDSEASQETEEELIKKHPQRLKSEGKNPSQFGLGTAVI